MTARNTDIVVFPSSLIRLMYPRDNEAATAHWSTTIFLRKTAMEKHITKTFITEMQMNLICLEIYFFFLGDLWVAWKSLCTQISTGRNRNVNHTGLSLQIEECITCYPFRRLGEDIVNSLMTVALSMWLRPHWILLKFLPWTCQFIEHVFMESVALKLPFYRTFLCGKCHT